MLSTFSEKGGLGLLLGRNRLVAVVDKGIEHISKDVLDLARPSLVLFLERRVTVELLPVDLRMAVHQTRLVW